MHSRKLRLPRNREISLRRNRRLCRRLFRERPGWAVRRSKVDVVGSVEDREEADAAIFLL